MENQNQNQHEYGSNEAASMAGDLRQFFTPIPNHHQPQFPPPPPPTLYSPAAAFPHHYDTMMLVMGGHDFRSDNSAAAAATPAMVPSSSVGGFGVGDAGATARWPRQETLTLLEIRSRLDHKFKEANHKGPLWDEVSRIMCDEHGYQRSGKKCREKFENLYKYYKKTKEGKAGRQDGKHYRFFRQLEALYGDSTHNQHQHHQNPISSHLNMISNPVQLHNSMNHQQQQEGFQSISLSNTTSDFSTSSSEEAMEMKDDSTSIDVMGRSSKKRRGSWKLKIKEFIDSQMKRIMEKQEAWLERMMRSLEDKEQERMMREEEWRKQEAMRMEREHRFWAKERAWIEGRDKALMVALRRITGKEVAHLSHDDDEENNGDCSSEGDRWGESEMIKLVELRASIQERFDECGGGPGEGDLWDEISARMACLGHDSRSANMCKAKWDFISKELSKKANNNSQQQHQYQHPLQTPNLLYNYGATHEMNAQGAAMTNPMNDTCFRILLGDGGSQTNPWEAYGVKLAKD